MAISEEQFERMISGTIHEKKHAKIKVRKRKAKPVGHKTDRLSGDIHKALPILMGMNILLNPFFWIMALVSATIGIGVLWGMGESLYNIIVDSSLVVLIAWIVFSFLLCKLLAMIKI